MLSSQTCDMYNFVLASQFLLHIMQLLFEREQVVQSLSLCFDQADLKSTGKGYGDDDGDDLCAVFDYDGIRSYL